MLPLLDPSVPLAKVAAHVKKRWRQHQRVELELCLGLRRLYRDNIHRGTGCGNFASYVLAKFDIPPKLTWTFSSLGEHLERLPLLVAAMESGEVTYTKAREFAPYIQPGQQEEWIEFARKNTNRAVEQRAGEWNAKRLGKDYVEKKKVTSSLNGLDTQAVRQAREIILKSTDEFIPETRLLPTMARMFVEGTLPAPGGVQANSDAEATGEVGKALKAPKPYLSIQACPCCLKTYVPVPGANMSVPAFEFLDRLRKGGDVVNLISHYMCDCEDAMHRRDECPRTKPRIEIPEEQVSRYVSAAARRVIEARDGFRCSVPGCLNELPLEGGHLHPFRRNGPPTARNVATQCTTCNRLIEEGRLEVVGVAPYEKYYLADGTFLGWGYDPEPFGTEGDGETGIPHVGQGDGPEDGAGGAGRICESRPVWGRSAVP